MKCGKVKFANESFANEYISILKKTSEREIKPVRAYLCPKCLLWHLTAIESKEGMQLIYKDREIKNLKDKVENLKKEIESLKLNQYP